MTEPTYPCVICRRNLPRYGMVCTACHIRVDDLLGEIADLYATLPEHLERGRVAGGQKVSGSREAPLPLRIDPLDLSMPAREPNPTPQSRLHPEDHAGAMSVASRLDSWVRDWREVRAMSEHPPDPTVVVLVGWLRNRLDWACDHHPAVDEFAVEMRQVHGALRAVVGIRSDRVYIGQCPVIDERGTCGAPLTADPYLDAIRCPRCDTLWARDKWLWLGMTLREDAA